MSEAEQNMILKERYHRNQTMTPNTSWYLIFSNQYGSKTSTSVPPIEVSIVTEAYKGNLSINHCTVTCSICLDLPSAIKNHREPPPNHQLPLQLDVKHKHLLFCLDHNVNRNLPDHNVNRTKGQRAQSQCQ